MQVLGRNASTPPLGLITVAALCPDEWRLRLVDEAVEALTEEDIQWADLVMVSAMHDQRERLHEILDWARGLGKRTMIGGPYASSEPHSLLPRADHVVVGEVEEVFAGIARDLVEGNARRAYRAKDKPDVTSSPVPRYDLLAMDRYTQMSIQFSRGCPFQCEFCDIITLFGRTPRTKSPRQLLTELDRLHELGWRREVFLVDDNFIGNRKRALELTRELRGWQEERGYPFMFWAEASVDLAQCPELIDGMVGANFLYVFLGIESPSSESLRETKKHQNLRLDLIESVRRIQERGLWVTGGFIIGFDSDTPEIFDAQHALITEAAIPWASIGFLQAPPTTPLFARLAREGRLIEDSTASSNFNVPNFHTKLPLELLLGGYQRMFASLYGAETFYERAFRSLSRWKDRPPQTPPRFTFSELSVLLRSAWYQGLRSSYRGAYWKFFLKVLLASMKSPRKFWLGRWLLYSGEHFVPYAEGVVRELEHERVALAARAQGPRRELASSA